MTLRRLPLCLTLALPLGCVAPWPALETCPDEGCPEATDTDGDPGATAGITITASASTGDNGDDSTSTTSDNSSTSAGEELPPPPPPSITDVAITPTPIHFNGPIAVEIKAANADGVRMETEDGELIELAPGDDADPTTFVGELAAMTGLDNGDHTVTLTPWRGDNDGEPHVAAYTIDLPTPGSEGFWETGDLIGNGFVAALSILPGDDLLELGTRYVNDTPRCYLRRRDGSGAWFKKDVIDLLDAQECTALDLAVAADGTIYLLLVRYDNGVPRWWLGELSGWGTTAKNVRVGNTGEEAVALALGPEQVAVCGSKPTAFFDLKDGAAWIHRPGLPGETKTFDYTQGGILHQFAETTRGCVFAGDELVLVGEAYGFHDGELLQRPRHFVYFSDTDDWFVASSGVGPQSGATAVTVDDKGRIVTAGYRCDDDCELMGTLEVHDKDGLLWHADIGGWPSKAYSSRAVAWSPAGYAVVASGGTTKQESAFMIRGFAPFESVEPLWTYVRKDADVSHMALALVVDAFGQIWAAGFGSSSYPAVAAISG